MGMGAAPVVPKGNGVIQPEIVFPTDGQYVLFLEFYPSNGLKETAALSLTVGSSVKPAPTPGLQVSLTQQIGDLTVTLKSDQPIIAKHPIYMNFEAIDAQGQSQTAVIAGMTGNNSQLLIVDDKLTKLLHTRLYQS